MDFSTLNKTQYKKIEWSTKTDGFKFKKLAEYFSNGEKVVQVFGFFFIKSKNYGLQPIAITKDSLLNLPTSKKEIISEMLKNEDIVKDINCGMCSLSIRQYKSKYNKICYDVDFINTEIKKTTDENTTSNENFQESIF